MKVLPTLLYYDGVPNKKTAQKLMADNGYATGPGDPPARDQDPLHPQALPNYQYGYKAPVATPTQVDSTTVPMGGFDTSKIMATPLDGNTDIGATPQFGFDASGFAGITKDQTAGLPNPDPKKHPTWGQYIAPAIGLADALIPGERTHRDYPIEPLPVYNPYAYGTGSQAIMDAGGELAKSGIHINPKNKGKFNATKKKTGKTTEELTHSSNPVTKKRAIFAQNAKKWKHEDGGELPMAPDGVTLPRPPANSTQIDPNMSGFSALNANRNDAYMVDRLNTILSTGQLTTGGSPEEMAMAKDAYIYHQKMGGGNPKDLIKSYYDQQADLTNPVNAYRRKLNGLSPLSLYNTTPDVGVQQLSNPTAKLKHGGKMKPYANNGLQVEDNQFTPISHNMIMLNGDKHEQGGTDIAYNGNQVEAEAGEPVSIGNNNEAIVWGNMQVPGSKRKFKTEAKLLGEAENKLAKHADKAQSLIRDNDPSDANARFAFNSGRIMQIGAAMGQGEINDRKTRLASLQNALLQVADQHGLDPQALSMGKTKKAKAGASLAKAGNSLDDDSDPTKPTRSDRHNNPGNLKFVSNSYQTRLGAVKGEKAPDGGYYAKFPTRDAGREALRQQLLRPKYAMTPMSKVIPSWTGGKPYNHDALGELNNMYPAQMSPEELNKAMDVMTHGEGTNYNGTNDTPLAPPTAAQRPPSSTPNPYTNTPYTYNPGNPLTSDGIHPDPAAPTPEKVDGNGKLPDIIPPSNRPKPTDAEALNPMQILPEIYGLATNKVEPVFMQHYKPNYYSPYQVSFQDRLNDNQTSFNQSVRNFGNNPNLVSALGAGQYAADNNVRADEFRTNQGIANDVTNKNVALSNDAQLKNLQLSDTQFVRQAEARSRTREITHGILNSVAAKYEQNQNNNRTLQAYENLYDYRFRQDPTGNGQAKYVGGPASLNYSGNGGQGNASEYSRTVVNKDASGNVTGTRTVTPSQQTIRGQELLNQQRQENTSPNRKFFRKLFDKR